MIFCKLWLVDFTCTPTNVTYRKISVKTRAVLVFATERKNNINVDPRLRSQKKVNYVQLFLALIILEFSHLDDIINPSQYTGKQVN